MLGKFVRTITTIFFTITFESHVNTVAIVALEVLLVASVDKGAVDFVAGVVAVGNIVAAPLSPHTLGLVAALEFLHRAYRSLAILFVALVPAIGIAVAAPPLHHALLLVLTAPPALRAVQLWAVRTLVAAVGAVGVAVAPPGF